jgi:putative ABC transport system permease protein
MSIRLSLLREVVVMALDTVRTNKMRSGLTVLGVVIGITSIVGMTSLIRGFDQSLRDMFRAIGPNTIFLQRFGATSIGADFRELLKRPILTVSDARAIEEQTTTLRLVDIELGAGGGPPTQERVFYRDQKTKPLVVFGTTEKFAEGTQIPILAGRFFNGTEVQYRKNVCVLGNTAYQLLFERRLQSRPGRLRRHSVHGLPADFRPARDPDRTPGHHGAHPNRRRAARRRQHRRGDGRHRARDADPP